MEIKKEPMMETANPGYEIQLKNTALTLKERVLAITVFDLESYVAAGELGKAMKELRAKIVTYFEPLKEAAHKAHKTITAREAEELEPVDAAVSILRDAMNVYTREQERIRRAEQDRLDRAAADRVAGEREKLLAQAVKAEAKGNNDRAEVLLEKAEQVYTMPATAEPTIAKTVQTPAGNITQTKEVQITVINLRAFLAELVRRDMAPTMLEVKAAALKSWQKANEIKNFPGLAINETLGVRF